MASLISRIREARRRWYRVFGLSAALGVVVGLALAGAEKVINDGMLGPLRRASLGVELLVPGLGLLVVFAILRGGSPFISDDYLRAYHDPTHPIEVRAAPARIVTGILTLGTGAAMGAEALGIYFGAVMSTLFAKRFAGVLTGENARIFLVAGAAAGVSGVFKAPATGAVFAIEVPYMQDMAAGAVIPSLVAATVAYLSVALVEGTSPILTIGASPKFGVPELLGAMVVGVVCGAGARLFVVMMGTGKGWALGHRVVGRAVPAGVALASFVALTHQVYGRPFTLGAGYDVIAWATDPRRGLALVALLFAIRLAATVATQSGGGTGGSFVPLVVQGALVGRFVQDLLQTLHISAAGGDGNLFVLVGMAAFLSAGYRVPLAAVMFVAETTGKPGFIVPGVLACVVAELMMGGRPASPYQRESRLS